MKKKRYKKLTAILAAVLLLCSGIPVMAAEVNNGTTSGFDKCNRELATGTGYIFRNSSTDGCGYGSDFV